MALTLTIISQSKTKIVVGWTPPSGTVGYEFLRDGKRVSSTFDGTVKQATFGIPDTNPHTFTVQPLTAGAAGAVTVNQPTPPPPPPPVSTGLPLQGVSVSNYFQGRSASDRAQELGWITDLANGHPTWVRSDWWPNTPAADEAIKEIKAAGLLPMGLYNFDGGTQYSVSQVTGWCVTLSASVDYLNFLNEPDLSGWTPAAVAQYSLAVYNAVKAAKPSCTIIGPSVWKTSSQNPADIYTYIQNVLSTADGKKMWDIYDHHLYDDANEVAPSWNNWDWVFRNNGKNIRNLLDSYPAYKGIPIICTEAGANADQSGAAYQNTCVVDGMAARQTLGLYSFGVYTTRNDSPPGGFGLYDNNLKARPAVASFRAAAT